MITIGYLCNKENIIIFNQILVSYFNFNREFNYDIDKQICVIL